METQSKIHLLSSAVVDQIAAGEVVERPAHLVKELVENSLDAKASEISVEFSEGGRQVMVTDNGEGILSLDLGKALSRHTTSKILSEEDLWKLRTFGFRGEALASIAAVAKVILSSKTKGTEEGTQIQANFSSLFQAEKVGHSFGTKVQVAELFANVPARLKFLKSAAAESTQIKTVMKALALSHPQVTFRVSQDRELVYLWPAVASRRERALQVLEIDELYEGAAERDGVHAKVLFADPNTTAKTSRNIWLFAQNRWVQDRTLQAAVMEAYRNLLMHGEYPIAVVWVETDPENIDVNIHPSKSQVKFAQPSAAFRSVQAALRDSLEKAPWLPSAVSSSGMKQESKPVLEEKSFQFQDTNILRTQFRQKEKLSFGDQPTGDQPVVAPPTGGSPAMQAQPGRYWSSLQILGQAQLTYLLCQSDRAVVIIDQHAAHERVLFEKLMAAWHGQKIEGQDRLFPLTVELPTEQVEALLKAKAEIARLGILIESLAPTTIGIHSAPPALRDSAIVDCLEKMAHDFAEHGDSHKMEQMIGDVCASMACHSAIVAGQAQSKEEIQALLANMDEFPLSSFCPHGRPVAVNYTFTEMERDFGRIV